MAKKKEKTANNMPIAGFVQRRATAIDHTPIYYFAITRSIKKDTIVVWDAAERTLYIVPKK